MTALTASAIINVSHKIQALPRFGLTNREKAHVTGKTNKSCRQMDIIREESPLSSA